MRQDVRDFCRKNYGEPTARQCDGCGLYIVGKGEACEQCGELVCPDCSPHCPPLLDQNLLRELDEWIEATGCIPKGGSWHNELKAFLMRAGKTALVEKEGAK